MKTILNIKTENSIFNGVLKITAIITELKRLNVLVAGIADICNIFAAPEFFMSCREAGIKPLLGCVFPEKGVVVYCENLIGYRNLCKILSKKSQNGDNSTDMNSSLPLFIEDFEKSAKHFDFEMSKNGLIEFTYDEKKAASFITDDDRETARILRAIKTSTLISSTPYIDGLFLSECVIDTDFDFDFDFDFGKTILPKFPLPENEVCDNFSYLQKIVFTGLQRKYSKDNHSQGLSDFEVAQKLALYELSIIRQTGFTDYFLITADFIAFAKSKKIAVGAGRGSGAGSVCAFALEITEVDPIKYGLIFERFLNPERVSSPDFDIDFCSERRGEVIDYVIKKYGEDKTAGILALGTFGARQAFRDAAKVNGANENFINDFVKNIPQFGSKLSQEVKNNNYIANLYEKSPFIHQILKTALKIEGLPRNTTLHAAGIVLTPEPLFNYAPINYDNYASAISFTKDWVEKLGILKMDFLGLRYLTVADKTAKFVGVDLSAIPEDDLETFKLIQRGDTSGVFQLESPGVISVLKRVRPANIEEIAAVTSLHRPGPMASIPQFIDNKNNPTSITYKSDILIPIIKSTYGCIVYQEQVMEICRTVGGFTLGEADLIRRAMSKKKPAELEQQKERFILGATKNNISVETANEIWNEIFDFAGYAFNKSHAVAYALMAYRIAYLKTHYTNIYLKFLSSDEKNLQKNTNTNMQISLFETLEDESNKEISKIYIKIPNGEKDVQQAIKIIFPYNYKQGKTKIFFSNPQTRKSSLYEKMAFVDNHILYELENFFEIKTY